MVFSPALLSEFVHADKSNPTIIFALRYIVIIVRLFKTYGSKY
jgi:hypothetical protein